MELLDGYQVELKTICAKALENARGVTKLPPEHSSANMAFGSAVHAAIAWWWEERQREKQPSEEDVLRVFRADWDSQV